MFVLRGLANFAHFPQPCLGSAANNPARQPIYKPGEVYSDQFSPTSNINAVQMTYNQAKALAEKTVKVYYERELTAVKALTPYVNSTCPPTSVNKKTCVGCTPTCYNFSPTTVAQTIPGTFEVFGVPFNIGEIGITKSPRFGRIYQPNTEQRIWVEWLIIKRSREELGKRVPTVAGRGYNPRKHVSVQQVLADNPDFKLGLNNMSIRSVSPTTDEFTNSDGGFNAWFDRGGYLIWVPVADGREPLMSESICPSVCTSILCKCGTSPIPACIGSGIPNSQSDNLGGCFYPYAAIDQAPPWNFVLRLIHDDPNWLEKAGAKIENFMQGMANAFCSLMPATQSTISNAVAEKCVDKNGNPCVKGASGCTCITPSAAAQGGAGIANYIGSKWCEAWKAEQAAYNPEAPIPPFPDPPPFVPAGVTIPWPLVIAGGLVAGAIAFTRK